MTDAHSLPQARPGLDAAFVLAKAVMIEYAQNPAPPRFPVGTVGHDRCVFKRNVDLIIETVGHPALDFFFAELAAVHPDIERMMNMVAGALGAQLSFKFIPIPRLGIGLFLVVCSKI